MPKFIATYGSFFGKGSTPEQAVGELREVHEEYDGWDSSFDSEVIIYEVGKQGKATLAVAWEPDFREAD